MSDSKCMHCGASMHRLTRWCQRCGKSAGNPQIPISYPTIPAGSIKPNPVNILPATAQPELGPTPSAFDFAPHPAMPQQGQSSSAFNFLPKSAMPEPSPSPNSFGSYPQAPPPQAEQSQTASAFNFLPKSVLPQSQSATNSSFQVPEYAAVNDNTAYPDPGLDSNGVWRDRNMMVAVRDAVLPNRCVKCNRVAEPYKITRKLYWHHPALYLLIFVISLLGYAIVALAVRRKAILDIPLCADHMNKRRMAMYGGRAGIIVGVLFISGSFSIASGEAFVLGLVLLMVGVIINNSAMRIVVPKKIENDYIWVKGVSKEFLNQLPSV